MDKDLQAERHIRLWEEQSRLVKRTVFGGLLFSSLLLINVLQPYSEHLDQTGDISAEIIKFERQTALIADSLSALTKLEQTFSSVQNYISQKPWNAEINKLRRKLSDLNSSGQGNWSNYQHEADATINTMASLANQDVVVPLEKILANESLSQNLSPALVQDIKALPKQIDEWKDNYKDNRWYRTVSEKQRTANQLTISLDRPLSGISRKIKNQKVELTRQTQDLESQIERLKKTANIDEKKALLPDWVKGMISLGLMVQAFPFVVLALAGYVLANAVGAASHFGFLVGELNFTTAGNPDAGFSSIWTLTYRGVVGTALTLAVYLSFMLVMWFFFEEGSQIVTKWMEREQALFFSQGSMRIISWLCRLALLGIVGLTAVYPFYQKRKSAGNA